MLLDDTDTPGDGNWEINVIFDGELSADGDRYESPLMDINYGLHQNVQLKYEVPYAFTRNGSSGDGHGIGDSMVGVK